MKNVLLILICLTQVNVLAQNVRLVLNDSTVVEGRVTATSATSIFLPGRQVKHSEIAMVQVIGDGAEDEEFRQYLDSKGLPYNKPTPDISVVSVYEYALIVSQSGQRPFIYVPTRLRPEADRIESKKLQTVLDVVEVMEAQGWNLMQIQFSPDGITLAISASMKRQKR